MNKNSSGDLIYKRVFEQGVIHIPTEEYEPFRVFLREVALKDQELVVVKKK